MYSDATADEKLLAGEDGRNFKAHPFVDVSLHENISLAIHIVVNCARRTHNTGDVEKLFNYVRTPKRDPVTKRNSKNGITEHNLVLNSDVTVRAVNLEGEIEEAQLFDSGNIENDAG